jgi:hypothetical protein
MAQRIIPLGKRGKTHACRERGAWGALRFSAQQKILDLSQRIHPWFCLASLRRCITALATLLIAVSPSACFADDWNFVVAPYLLVPSISGDASLGRIDDAEVDISGSDILRSLELGAMLQVEARHKSGYGAMLNYAFMDLGKDFSGPLGYVDIDTNIFQGTLEGFGTYRIEYTGGTLDLYAGARWWHIGLDVDASTPLGDRSYSRNEDWVDPVIGARWAPRMTESLRLLLQGDVGGFGAGSDFTWCAQAGILWDVSDATSVALLYKALGVDYQTGTRGTPSFFEYDTITQGPVLGLVLRF